jgi:hypothetical protein
MFYTSVEKENSLAMKLVNRHVLHIIHPNLSSKLPSIVFTGFASILDENMLNPEQTLLYLIVPIRPEVI